MDSWYNRLDTDIMIIGQDWGPFSDMKKLNEQYIKKQTKENWINLIETERSNTKKLLAKYIMESSNGKMTNLDKVLCVQDKEIVIEEIILI